MKLVFEVTQIVLRYIANNDIWFPVFVMNRPNEIHLHSMPGQWHTVPTSQNPANCCTCFVLFSKLKFHLSWLNGPTLLEQQVNSVSADNKSDKILEIEQKLTNNPVQTKGQNQFYQMGSYSSLKKLVLHIASLLKFKQL